MCKTIFRQRERKTQTRRGLTSQPIGVWVRLPKSVVNARAGLVPSEETDNNPPPDDLTSKELLAWHRGLPVFLSAERFLAYLGTARFSAWRRALPVAMNVAPARLCDDQPQRAN